MKTLKALKCMKAEKVTGSDTVSYLCGKLAEA